MTSLAEAILELRIAVLARLAQRRGLRVELDTIRRRAAEMSDRDVLRGIPDSSDRFGWVWALFHRRP